MNPLAIETDRLTKQYGKVVAVSDLDLRVPTGSVCALVGRNGAGKTTTIRMLLGMVRPTRGEGAVLGLPIDEVRASVEIRCRVAFVDPSSLYPRATVRELLSLVRGCYRDWNTARETAGLLALDLPLDRKVDALSKGMRTKLAVMLALSRDAELYVFDEPTEGLDPVVREQVLRALVAVNAARGATLLVSSHQLAELEEIADTICVMDRARLVLSGAMDHVRATHHRVDAAWSGEAPVALAAIPGVVSAAQHGAFATLIVAGDVSEALAGMGVKSVDVHPASLKEIVLAYASTDTRDDSWVTIGAHDAVA